MTTLPYGIQLLNSLGRIPQFFEYLVDAINKQQNNENITKDSIHFIASKVYG